MSACEVCGTADNLRHAPLMTGEKLSAQPARVVCSPCFRAWYESGETTVEGLLRYRLRHETTSDRAQAVAPRDSGG